MTLAAIVPIGDPRVNGYGNNLAVCLRSMAEFADMVILVQSHPAASALYPFLTDTISLISNEATWFPNGVYDGRRFNKNVRIGETAAKQDGADVFILLTSNWYIPESSREALRIRCDETMGWDWAYRGNQLAGKLFSASKRLPAIWRDGSGCYPTLSPDGMQTPVGFVSVESGDYSGYDDEMIVDVPLEITLINMAGKMNFFRCYHDDMPKRNPVFDWDYWHPYYTAKMRYWKPTDIQLDEYGQAIADASKPEYLSHLFLKEMAA